MLTPQQLACCADDILNLYSKLEEEIIRDIARRITKSGVVTETGKLQFNALNRIGMLHTDVLKTIGKYIDKSEVELKQLFEDAAVTATEYDNEIYRANGLNPKSIKVSPAAMQILEAGYKKTNGNIKKLTRTTAVTSQTSFMNACTMAEMKVESGAYSVEQAISDAVKQIAFDGAYVLYPSGHRDRIDVAVRRNVMTGLGQTTGQICLQNAQELGCDLMEITAHAGARPSHAAWQGQIVSLSGQQGYLSTSDIGYGTGAGFKGWNCRHDWYPYFEGSKRMYSDKHLAELDEKNIEFPDGTMHTYYEAEQRQRYYERKIRETRRYLTACDSAIENLSDEKLLNKLNGDFGKVSVKLKRQEAELKAFCSKTGLLPDNARSQVYGFGKSVSQKAVGSANKHYKTWSGEHNVNNIKTLAKYYNVKYNNSRRYALLKTYVNSIDRGMLSPLAGFDLYEQYYKKIESELVGLTTASGLKIRSQSKHFLERVFGTKEDPTHENRPRSGVAIDDVKEALTTDREPKYSSKRNSFLFTCSKCQVSVNPNGNLIHTNQK